MEGAYIISPLTVYFIGIVDSIRVISIISMVSCILGMIIATMCFICSEDTVVIKWIKKFLFWTIISIILLIFVPSKNTMIRMTVAKNVTYENIVKGTEITKQSIDYIFDKIQQLDKE